MSTNKAPQQKQQWPDQAAAPAQHPLADLANVRHLIERLPTNDSLSVLRMVSAWVADIVQIPDLPLKQELEVLNLFDRFAKDHQLNLMPEYLDTQRMLKLSETQLWKTSFSFWKTLGNAYLHCLERFQSGDDTSAEFHAKLPMIVGRSMRSLALQLKWSLLRYGQVDERIWRDLGRAYLFAENRHFSAQRSAIYPGSHGESSAQEELLKALMLQVSAPDALTPIQQHIAERMVAFFSMHFAIHTTPGAGCLFAFDLSMHLPPHRAKIDTATAPLLRFFGPGTALAELNALVSQIEQLGTLPADTPLKGNFPVKDILVVLDHLARCWGEVPPTRRGHRRDLVTRLTVMPGFTDTVQWMEKMIGAGTVEVAVPETAENWVVIDASDGGYGAVVAARPGDWLAIGALAGIRPETSNTCQMAILRRITNTTEGHQKIGMQLIGDTALPVTLYPAQAKPAAGSMRGGESAILINRRPDAAGRIELLLKPGIFMHNRTLRMRFMERMLMIEFLESLGQTREYHHVAYRLQNT